MTSSPALDRARELDAADQLGHVRELFFLPDDTLYFDGNSLGRLPKATLGRLDAAVRLEWGTDLITGWQRWIHLPAEVGDELGQVCLGVEPGQVVVCDNTTVNLYKLAMAAARARPQRTVIVTDDDNFPTDRYVLEEVARTLGLELRVIASDIDQGVDLTQVAQAVTEDVALVSLSHTAYRSGALAPLREIDRLAHEAGALTLWDLSHTVGSVLPDLSESDLAVGCSYKYLNGGPGAPAWLYVRRDLQEQLANPIPGWFSHADQFAMDSPYRPRSDAGRFLTGTPGLLGLVSVQEGVRSLAGAGITTLQAKGEALTDYLVELVDAELPGVGVASPRDATKRGSHVTLRHPEARRLAAELIEAGVVVDYREPERMRWGLVPAYTRFVDVHEGVQRLKRLLEV